MTWYELAFAIAIGVYIGGSCAIRGPLLWINLRARGIIAYSRLRERTVCRRQRHRAMKKRYRPIGASREDAARWTAEVLCRDCSAVISLDTVPASEVPNRARQGPESHFLDDLFRRISGLGGEDWRQA